MFQALHTYLLNCLLPLYLIANQMTLTYRFCHFGVVSDLKCYTNAFFSFLERPHDSTRAIKENGIKPDRPPERPLPPRETEALQPTDDDFGENGLSPYLPSGAAGISRLLPYHQKEEQLGHEKIALEEQIVDRQDLGD